MIFGFLNLREIYENFTEPRISNCRLIYASWSASNGEGGVALIFILVALNILVDQKQRATESTRKTIATIALTDALTDMYVSWKADDLL